MSLCIVLILPHCPHCSCYAYILLFCEGIDLTKKTDSSTVASASASDKDKSKEDGRKSAIPVGIAVARQRSGASSKQKGLSRKLTLFTSFLTR